MTHLNVNLPSLSGPAGAGTPAALATQLARRADANGDGQVSNDEFDQFLTNLLQQAEEPAPSTNPLDIVRRLLGQHQPTSEGQRDLLAAIANALPGTERTGTDTLDVPGLGRLTIRAGGATPGDWTWQLRGR